MNSAQRHCHDLVREHAKDHYLASLFMPESKRPHALALYAFDAEIARIPNAVSEPQLGLIRQQWWLDTLDDIHRGETPAHPVAEALSAVIADAKLPRHALRGIIEARAFDLYADPMPDLQALETYLGQTSSALIQLVSLVLAGPGAQSSAGAAGLAGVAIGLARLLYERPLRHLPEGMDMAAAIVHAQARLAEARGLKNTIAAVALPAYLPASLTGLYLNAAHSGRMPSQFRRQIAMWWTARGRGF